MNIIDKVSNKLRYESLVRQKKKESLNVKQIKWAIIGSGSMANTFARALRTTSGANVVAVASRTKDRAEDFAKKYNIPKAYGNYDSMLQDKNLDIDVVYIATPAFAHYENIKSALLNHRNVLCEKPIVPSSSELYNLVSIAKKNNLFLAEGMWMLFLPVFKKAEEWLIEGRIGDIQKIRIDLSKQERIDYSRAVFSADQGGGVLSDYGIYPIVFALHFLGTDVNIVYADRVNHSRGFDIDWTIVLSDGHISANITISSVFNGDKKAIIIGNKGTIVWSPQFNRTNSIFLINDEGQEVDHFSIDYIADGYEYEIETVQESIAMGKTEDSIIPLSLSQKTISIMEKLWQHTLESRKV